MTLPSEHYAEKLYPLQNGVRDVIVNRSDTNFFLKTINWAEIIREAKQKEAGLEITYVCGILKSMPQSEFESVAWVAKPDWEVFCDDIGRIVNDMLAGVG